MFKLVRERERDVEMNGLRERRIIASLICFTSVIEYWEGASGLADCVRLGFDSVAIVEMVSLARLMPASPMSSFDSFRQFVSFHLMGTPETVESAELNSIEWNGVVWHWLELARLDQAPIATQSNSIRFDSIRSDQLIPKWNCDDRLT